MQNKNIQIEIVDYDKTDVPLAEIKAVFLRNFMEMKNARNIKGLYYSMLAKYGNNTYSILLLPALLLYFILKAVLKNVLESETTAIYVSIAIALSANYFFFIGYVLRKMKSSHSEYGNQMRDSFDKIDEKYKKNGGTFLLALVNNPKTNTKELVGTLGFRQIGLEEKKSFRIKDTDSKSGIIEAMGVSSKYRGLGFAKKLMERGIRFAEEQKYDAVYLGVANLNDVAIELYKKYGFKKVYTMEFEPISGVSGCLMMKYLK